MSVLLNAVLGLESLAVLGGGVTLRAPGKEVTTDLDVVVRELAVLVIIHTKKLSLFRGTELKARDEIDDLGDEGGDNEGVGASANDSSELPAHNNVVAVEEATDKAAVDTIEAGDLVGSEETVEDEADHTTDVMLSENVEGIVDADQELDYETKY